jgi:hypothetical protein
MSVLPAAKVVVPVVNAAKAAVNVANVVNASMKAVQAKALPARSTPRPKRSFQTVKKPPCPPKHHRLRTPVNAASAARATVTAVIAVSVAATAAQTRPTKTTPPM